MSSPSHLFGTGTARASGVRPVRTGVTTWSEKRVLIVVRTYPVPASKGVEVSCTAAVTSSGEWIRLFPVPYRFLDEDKRFRKYQWIIVSLERNNLSTDSTLDR